MTKVFIDGETGTTGLGIRRRLEHHPAVKLLDIDPALRKDTETRRAMFSEADIAFLCLPDEAAREAVALAKGSSARILDASTAHRTSAGWAYGLPELSDKHRAQIACGSRIAVPGCHASGMITLAYPLRAAGLLGEDAVLCFTSITGYTGGGKAMIAQYNENNRAAFYDAPRQYGLSQSHKHLPEVSALCRLAYEPAFLPIVADFPQGLLVTMVLFRQQLAKRMTLDAIWELYAAHYANCPVIRVLPRGAEENQNGFLAANALAHYDGMQVIITGNDERMLLHARFDNLGKGASGAALQCMNIMLGMHETNCLSL